MNEYRVIILVEVFGNNKDDAIIEAKNTIYNSVHDDQFVVSRKEGRLWVKQL